MCKASFFVLLLSVALLACSGSTPEPPPLVDALYLRYRVASAIAGERLQDVGECVITASADPEGAFTVVKKTILDGAGDTVRATVDGYFRLSMGGTMMGCNRAPMWLSPRQLSANRIGSVGIVQAQQRWAGHAVYAVKENRTGRTLYYDTATGLYVGDSFTLGSMRAETILVEKKEAYK